MPVLENYASRWTGAKARQIPAEVSERVQLHLLDSLGAWIAGRASREGKALAGDTLATSTTPALFEPGLSGQIALGVAQIRLTEVDDIHMPSCTTPGSVLTPSVLLLAKDLGSGRDQILAALAAGYDATTRLGLAIDGARILYRGVWPTYFCAPFGTALAASVLFGLDAKATGNALALALVQVSGAAGGPAPGRNPRWMLAGRAAACGVQAAISAARGFGGDTSLLDGDWLANTHGIALSHDAFRAETGALMADMSMKTACTAKQAASSLTAFQTLLAKGVTPSNINSATIHVPPAYVHMIGGQPPGRIGRIVSARWQCALAAFHPGELLDIERTDHSGEADFAALTSKISIVGDAALQDHFPKLYPARIEALLCDGRTETAAVFEAPGDGGQALDKGTVEAKFLQLASAARGVEGAQASLAAIADFMADKTQVSDLCGALAPKSGI